MNPSSSELTFASSPSTIVFGVVLVLVTLVLSFLIWKRNHFSRGTLLLEILRILAVILVAISLNQPEWREIFEPEEKPAVAVLWDRSGSMRTADILDAENPAAPLQRRNQLVSQLIEREQWGPLEDKTELLFESFSSSLEPAESASDIGSALDDISEQNPNLRGIVLLSDGDWNEGAPPAQAATRLRMRETPVFALPVGSESHLPDLRVEGFDVPTFAIADKPVRLPFTLRSTLPVNRSVIVEVLTSQGDKISREVTIPAMGRVQDAFQWKPGGTGDVNLTLRIPKAEEERNEANNQMTAPIAIRKEQLHVLLIETFPRWEYRYLRNALERDPGVEVNCLLFHPDIDAAGGGKGYLEDFPDPELLAKFDVIFLGDVGVGSRMLSEKQCDALRQQVSNQASGLVFLPGFRGHQHTLLTTSLRDLFPVILDEAQARGWGSPAPGQFELTDHGLRSLLTRLADTEDENQNVWTNLPGFQWFAGVSRAQAGAEVLATHSSESNRYGRIPLIVTKTFGTGKILYMGTDGAWRWRKGVEDTYHYRFWAQVSRWMAYQRNMASGELMRLFYSPDRPQLGEVLTLNANVLSVGGEPLQDATVVARVTAPSGKIESIRLQSGGEEMWGLFSAGFVPNEPGEYQLELSCSENGGVLEASITVQGAAREKTDQPARHDVMEEIARITRGELITEPNISTIIDRISAIPDPDPMERRLRIWAHPLWACLLILVLIVFWIGRKVIGAV